MPEPVSKLQASSTRTRAHQQKLHAKHALKCFAGSGPRSVARGEDLGAEGGGWLHFFHPGSFSWPLAAGS